MGYNCARLMADFRKYKGFVPCGLSLEPPEERAKVTNRCPPPWLPPCRDPTHPDYNHRGKWAWAHKRFKISTTPDDPCLACGSLRNVHVY